jgi:hypothetical protein
MNNFIDIDVDTRAFGCIDSRFVGNCIWNLVCASYKNTEILF